MIPKVQAAVNYGLQVLDSAFEQLDIKAGNSDSEDEETNDRVEPILEPKVQHPPFFNSAIQTTFCCPFLLLLSSCLNANPNIV